MWDIIFQGPKGQFVLIDWGLSILAILFNVVVLDAIVKSPFSLKGYRRFLISLTISDLYLTTVNLTYFIFQISPNFLEDAEFANCGSSILRSFQLVGFSANLLNLCGMSIDHVIGLISQHGFVKFAVLAVWVLSFLLGFLDIPVAILTYLISLKNRPASIWPSPHNEDCNDITEFFQPNSNPLSLYFMNASRGNLELNPAATLVKLSNSKAGDGSEAINSDELYRNISDELCRVLKGNSPENQALHTSWCNVYKKPIVEYCIIILALCCFVFLTFCYRKIVVSINGISGISRRKSSKLIKTTCILLGAFALCYLPFMAFEFAMPFISLNISAITDKSTTSSLLIAHNVLNSLLMSYPLFDPIIYSARLPMVQRHILLTLAKLMPCFREFFISHAQKRSSERVSQGSVVSGQAERPQALKRAASTPAKRTAFSSTGYASHLSDQNKPFIQEYSFETRSPNNIDYTCQQSNGEPKQQPVKDSRSFPQFKRTSSCRTRCNTNDFIEDAIYQF